MNYPKKNEIIKSLMEIQSTVFDSLSAERNDQTISDQQQQQHQQQQQQQQRQFQQLLEHNQQTMYEQHQQQIQQNQHTQNIELPQQQQQQQQQNHYLIKTQQQQVEPKNQNRSIYVSLKMIYMIFSEYGQQSIFKKHAKLIFLYAKEQVNLKDTHF